MRWAAIEACQHSRPGTKLAADRARIIAARGRNIGVVDGLRDGQIRALANGLRERVGTSRTRDRWGYDSHPWWRGHPLD